MYDGRPSVTFACSEMALLDAARRICGIAIDPPIRDSCGSHHAFLSGVLQTILDMLGATAVDRDEVDLSIRKEGDRPEDRAWEITLPAEEDACVGEGAKSPGVALVEDARRLQTALGLLKE